MASVRGKSRSSYQADGGGNNLRVSASSRTEEQRDGSQDAKEDTKTVGRKKAQKAQKEGRSLLRLLCFFAAILCHLELVWCSTFEIFVVRNPDYGSAFGAGSDRGRGKPNSLRPFRITSTVLPSCPSTASGNGSVTTNVVAIRLAITPNANHRFC